MKKYTTTRLAASAMFFGFIITQAFAQTALTNSVTDTVAIDQVSSCTALTYDMRLTSRDTRTAGQVTDLQAYLQDGGYLSSDPTGYFGTQTYKAVQGFQRANGITPNGLVGPLTRAKIKLLSCGLNSVTQTLPQATTTVTVANQITSSLANASPLPQMVIGGTSQQIATFTLKTTNPGSQATIRELRFTTVGDNAIESVSIGGTTVPVVAGTATIRNLDILIGTSGYDLPVRVKYTGFQNGNSGGILTSAIPSVGIKLVYIEASNSLGQTIAVTTSVGSNSMVLVASKPTVTMNVGGTGPLVLGVENKIAEFSVTADVNGKISLVRSSISVSSVGVQNFQISAPRILLGSTTIPGSFASVDGGTVSLMFNTPFEILPGQTQTFSVFATVQGSSIQGVDGFLASRFTSPATFYWKDVVGANVTYNGDKIYNFPTTSFLTARGVTQITNSSSVVEFIGTPVLKLVYSVYGKEAELIATAKVKVTAGSTGLSFPVVNGAPKVITIRDLSGGIPDVYSEIISVNGGSSGVKQLAPNESVTYDIKYSVSPRILFAGAYQVTAYGVDDNTPGAVFNRSSYKGITTGNTVVIAGEISPYIRNIQNDASGRVTITGVRFDAEKNIINFGNAQFVTSSTENGTTITFNPANYGVTLSVGAQYVVQVTSLTNGASNRTSLAVISIPTSPSVSLANPTLLFSSPIPQFVIGGSTFGIATYKLATASAGSQAIVRELRFKVKGTDSIQMIKVGGISASVGSNGVAIITGLSIPISSTGTDVPVTVVYSGFQNSTTGGFLQTGMADTGISLNYVEATTGAGSVITNTTVVSSPSMSLVASKPTVTISTEKGNVLLLGSENKIGEFTVSADANGKISLSSANISISPLGISPFNLSSARLTVGGVTLPGSRVSTSPNIVTLGGSAVNLLISFGEYEIPAGQTRTFAVYAVVNGQVVYTPPYISSRLYPSSEFVWRDVVGGNSQQTGEKIYNFPSNYWNTLQGIPTVADDVLGQLVVYRNEVVAESSVSTEESALAACKKYVSATIHLKCVWGNKVIYESFPLPDYEFNPNVTPTSTPATSNKFSSKCSVPGFSGLAAGTEVCYGVWDYGDALGGDVDMCGGYGSPRTGCIVSAPACTSKQAVAVKYYTVQDMSQGVLEYAANNMSVTPDFLKKSLVTLWVYNCTAPTMGLAPSMSGQVLGASSMCVDLPFNFHRGNQSPSTKKLQEYLTAKGYFDGGATGFYGDKTVAAVKDYQRAKGLPETGMVYDFTRSAIKEESCRN